MTVNYAHEMFITPSPDEEASLLADDLDDHEDEEHGQVKN
jgi:hypothetical protein